MRAATAVGSVEPNRGMSVRVKPRSADAWRSAVTKKVRLEAPSGAMLQVGRRLGAERESAMRRALAGIRRAGQWVLRQLGRIVNDSPASTRPPGGNYIPNSNGEGGRVISSGDSGANS